MKVFISFLGTGNYQDCVYDGYPKSVKYVQTATRALFAPDASATFIFCTKDAEAKHWNGLVAEFTNPEHGLSAPTCIDIADGKSEEELWKNFQTIVDCIPDNSEIVFDPTHSLRSLPIIMTVLLHYLEVVKHTVLKGCFYGAYDARNQETNVCPIFDLTPFFALNDWTSAIHDFSVSGNAETLEKLSSSGFGKLMRNPATRSNDIAEVRKFMVGVQEFTDNVRYSDAKALSCVDFKARFQDRFANITNSFLPPLQPIFNMLGKTFAGYPDSDCLNGLRAARWAYEHGMYQPKIGSWLQEIAI